MLFYVSGKKVNSLLISIKRITTPETELKNGAGRGGGKRTIFFLRDCRRKLLKKAEGGGGRGGRIGNQKGEGLNRKINSKTQDYDDESTLRNLRAGVDDIIYGSLCITF